MLQVNQLSKRFEGGRGVGELNFSMQRGEIVGFLGPNGAGKTTSMRLITGYLQPTGGQVLLDSLSVHDQGRRARSRIGYLPENPPLYHDMTVYGYLSFVASLRDVPAREQKSRISEMISRLGLNGRERQLVRSLSKGYKQRLGLAGAIIHKPDLLVLDEPTSGLDPNQILEIRQLIRELGEQHTVLLSTHILPEVNTLCNRVLIINQGKIVLDGSPDAIAGGTDEPFKVAVELKGAGSRVESLFHGWEHATAEVLTDNTEKAKANPETVRLLLTGRSAEDFRESLFYLLSEAGIPVLEMKKENLSLEQIFQKLTTNETPAQNEELPNDGKEVQHEEDDGHLS
ncbi:ABC transporter ATP-binding protein [Paenibacillus sp. P96]|uniref:ABC transporter ATP-binding protein n=1 Tax=Paenibacillus zeirhizosphaerae TaxID=2987519 RepID=A0ABT9FUS7_9BACL|nr:ATP-binding cassette domain-containing protein [Paenibacillus sp. P96]MDP4098496.1 ABC transporter ATP-binding protein [Paenibacillus sp. P96]